MYQTLHPALANVITKLPPVPSLEPVYKTTVTTTTNEDTTTFAGVDIGTPHPKRIVILGVHSGVEAAISATVNGIAQYHLQQNSALHGFGILAHQVPNGTTADIAVTAAVSLRKTVAVWVAYPHNPIVLDGRNRSDSGTTPNTLSNIITQRNGFLIYSGGYQGNLATFSTTWSGTEAVTEDVDAQIESAATYHGGRISSYDTSGLFEIVATGSVSGTKRLVICSWGPAYGNS